MGRWTNDTILLSRMILPLYHVIVDPTRPKAAEKQHPTSEAAGSSTQVEAAFNITTSTTSTTISASIMQQ